MQYSYKTQELIEKGVDFSTLFPEKQAAVQQMTGVDFSLPQIVEFIKVQTDGFTKENLLALDLDKYINGIYLKYTTAKEKETAPETEPAPAEPTKEDLQSSLEGLETMLEYAKGKEKKDIKAQIDGIKTMLELMGVTMELGGMIPNSHKATLITALVNHFGISRNDAIKVVNETNNHQALMDLIRDTPVQKFSHGGIFPTGKQKDFQRAKQKLNREYLVHKSLSLDEYHQELQKLHEQHGTMARGGIIPTAAGQKVMFKEIVDPGDEDQEFEVIWIDKPRAMIKALNTGMAIEPTQIVNISDIKLVTSKTKSEMLGDYTVSVNYQTTSGKPTSKRVEVKAKNEDEAIDLANAEIKKLPNYLKIVGGDVVETPQFKFGGRVRGMCQTGTEIQALIFSKDHWTRGDVMIWAKNHGFKHEIDEKKNTYHIRQHNPDNYFKKSFKTTSFDDKLPAGILAVIGCPKKSKK